MRKLTLNLTGFEKKDALHSYLKAALELPPYYGGNLDALYDELTHETEDTDILILCPACGEEAFCAYLSLLVRVFEEAAEENRRLHVTCKQKD